MPDPAQVWELERAKYQQRVADLLTLLADARSYVSTLKLGLEAMRLYVVEGVLNQPAALHKVCSDLETWLVNREAELNKPIETNDATLH